MGKFSVDAAASSIRTSLCCTAQNCTVIQANTVGRFCDLCICVIIVSLSIIASSFCQLVNNFFAVKILGEPHERIQTRVDVLVLDAIYQ
jgi:hypothetical protein